MKIRKRIKFWFWWHFKATDMEKILWDEMVYGRSFMKNGKRINPKKFIC